MTQTYQSGFETTLVVRLNASDTTATLATVPTVTKGRMYLDNGEQKEWLSFTGVSGSTITGLTRGLSQTEDPATAGTGLTWIAGTKIKLVAMHDQMADKLEGDQALFSAKVYATTAARDAALGGDGVATKAYYSIYVTATGLFYNYSLSSNQRTVIDTGTATPNASQTAAGSVENATTAEGIAGSSVGGTGALLFMTPAQIAAQIQSGTRTYDATSGGTDTYVAVMVPAYTAVSYETGMSVRIKLDVGNTGACSLNIGTPGAANIKTQSGADPSTGDLEANDIVTFIFDGTNRVIQNITKSSARKIGAYTAYIYGDGSDGDVTIGSNTTLTRDMYYNNLTISNGFVLSPAGYKIYVKGTLTNNGTIRRNGNAGGAGGAANSGAAGTAGTAGAAVTGGTLGESPAGGAGGAGVNGGNVGLAGSAGGAATPSYSNVNGSAGGAGGTVGGSGAGAAGAGGTTTRGSLYNTLYSLERVISMLGSPSSFSFATHDSAILTGPYKGPAGGGGGGSGRANPDTGVRGGGGGGGGSAGGTIRIAAKTLNNAGVIESIGGTGGAGGANYQGDANDSVGGAGGGGGGNGGIVYLIYETLTALGTVTVTGGTGGAGSAGITGSTGGTATNGTNGTNGSAGTTIQIQTT